METCVCDISALAVYRSYGRLLPQLLECRRTSKLDDCKVPAPQMLADDARRLGAGEAPYHLAFASPNQARARQDIRRHVYAAALPRNAFIRIDRDTLISSPEFLFVELCSHNELSDLDLAMLGYELCGTYTLDEDDDSWSTHIENKVSLTSKEKLFRMVGNVGNRPGVARARRILKLIEDGSNSPMETVLVLLVHLPRSMGGLGLGPVTLNKQVGTSTGPRWVDVFLDDSGVGIEYKGRRSHSIEKTGRDDRRQNKLVGSGVTVLNVWYEDLFYSHLFDQFVQDLFDALKKRKRFRGESFPQRQKLLRMHLMPLVERSGSFE